MAYAPLLRENRVIVEDNKLEVQLGEAEERQTVSVEVYNALELSELPAFRSAGFTESVYIGILANTPRLEICKAYFDYLVHMGA